MEKEKSMEDRIETTPISELQPSFGKDLPGFGDRYGRPVDYIPPKIRGVDPRVVSHNPGNDDDDQIPWPEFSSHEFLDGGLFITALSKDDESTVFSTEMCRLTPLRELQMMRWMNIVTDKENWEVKVTITYVSLEKRLMIGEENDLS